MEDFQSPEGLFITPMFPPQIHWGCDRGRSQEVTCISSHESDTCCSRRECKTWMVRALSRFLSDPSSQTLDENFIMIWTCQLRTSGQSDLRFEWFGSLRDTGPESRYIWTDIIELALLCIVLLQTFSICVFNYGSEAPTTDIPGGIDWAHTCTHTHTHTHTRPSTAHLINCCLRNNAHLWSLNYIWPTKYSIKNINIKMNGLYLNGCSVKGLKTPVFKLLIPNKWKKLVLDFLWFSQYGSKWSHVTIL